MIRCLHRLSNFFRFARQRITRGFPDSDLWNLDVTVATWILPRLRRYRDMASCYPPELDSFEEWQAILNKMILAFAYITANDTDEDGRIRPEVEQGLDLFRHFYLSLWD